MKKVLGEVKVFIIISAILYCFGAQQANASEYLGEFCWGDESATMLLAVTHMGDGHYLVYGRITEFGGTVIAINGNAELVGNEVIMHTSSSGSTADTFWIYEDRITLNLPALDIISIENISHYIDSKPGGEIIHQYEYNTETMPRIPCP